MLGPGPRVWRPEVPVPWELVLRRRNAELITGTVRRPEPSEAPPKSAPLRCHLLFSAFQRAVTHESASPAAGHLSQPAVTGLLFLALVWTRT